MKYDHSFTIGQSRIAIDAPTYFIADIAANHDGSLERAKDLIRVAKEAGADCAKFQHFLADKIVSDVGFSDGVGQVSHQAGWKKSVSEIYDQYHTRREWTDELVATCKEVGIDFMTTPYDVEAVRMFKGIIPAYKVGSGDITFTEILREIAAQGAPVLLATGAADMAEVETAAETVLAHNSALCLMQCNTNYTGSLENFKYVNLRVLETFAQRWPGMPLGFSDHTPGHSAVLGAVALGARVVEKHFTDDNDREGPDHSFALNPVTWRAMVDAVRELEYALGDGVKRIEANEKETVVIQRRALRMVGDLPAGTVLAAEHLEALRPCPEGAVSPDKLEEVLGKVLKTDKARGRELMWTDIG
jgi:N-acetylneuraminate synthase